MYIPPTGKKARSDAFLSLATGLPIAPRAPSTPITLDAALGRTWEKRGKYGNQKTEYNGRTFDSALEANTARDLDLLRRASDLSERVVDVQYQVPFVLQEKFTDSQGKKHQAIVFVCDFVITYADGRKEALESKGFETETWKIKKKLFLFKYRDINFRQV